MNSEEIYIIAGLIYKYLRNDLTSGEKEILDEWMERSEENKREFEYICSNTFLEQYRQQELQIDVTKAYKRFVSDRRKGRKIRFFKQWSRIAAILVVAIGCGWMVVRNTGSIDVVQQEIMPGSSCARLTLADGQIIKLNEEIQDSVLGDGVRVDRVGKSLEYTGKSVKEMVAFNTLEVPRKGEFKVILEDGTKVWLNSESVLRYPVIFSGSDRKVYLKGEAYFEVAPDLSHPFIVNVEEAEIRVLGTAFNIHSYDDDPQIHTTLAHGCIRICRKGQEMMLKPGEQTVIHRSSDKMEKREVDITSYISWKDGRFVFKKQRLEDIMKTLIRWYDVKVSFTDETLKEITFSGNLERYTTFDQIVSMLEMMQMASFKVEGSHIIISRKR